MKYPCADGKNRDSYIREYLSVTETIGEVKREKTALEVRLQNLIQRKLVLVDKLGQEGFDAILKYRETEGVGR